MEEERGHQEAGDSSRQLKKIEVREIIRAKSPALAKRLPGFIIRYLERTLRQREVNQALELFGHLREVKFVEAILDFMEIEYHSYGTANIPESGRFLFVSNHPLGGLDGMVFINEVSKKFADIKFPVNDILLNITNLADLFLPINKHGSQARHSARAIEEAYASEAQILYFPAGLCSRRKRGVITDLAWHNNFIRKAVSHKRDIIPVFISGRNSSFFYTLSNLRRKMGIKANIEMLYLVDEMLRQKGKEITISFGEPIPWSDIDGSRSPSQWADYIRKRSYDLEKKLPR